MSFSAQDHRHMARALRLAERGLNTTDPNPRVGCVIAHGADCVGQGFHQRAGEPHAEVHALKEAGSRARDATVYVTLEPCSHHGRTPPCADALIDARVARVVIAAADPNPDVAGDGIDRLNAAGIDVATGLLADPARELNAGYFKRRESGLPLVRIKVAVSVDGRTALADGTSRWISGVEARADVQRWRARSSAILTGIGTALADDPSLNVRADELRDVPPPLRCVVDSDLRLPAAAKMLSLPGDVLVFAARDAQNRVALESAGADIELVPEDHGHVSLRLALQRLADRQINEVLVEAGPTLCGALISAGLADELLVYVAPHLLGDTARGMFDFAVDAMDARPALQLIDSRQVGQDFRFRYQIVGDL